MPTEMQRFTAWLSDAERHAVKRWADDHGTSENYVVRMAIRQTLQLGAPRTAATKTAEKSERV